MPRAVHRFPALSACAWASLLFLAACGGGGGTTAETPAAPAAPEAPGATALSGSVAVGAPITNGKLRIIDADGAVVAEDVAVDADGRYADVTLTGPAPYRIEACGYAGPNYLCVYSVAQGAGTANVTPLTTATVLLAAGQSPDTLMTGTAAALTADSIDGAQTQLRTGLASVLAAAQVDAGFDFVSGSLDAGSRSGYDAVLDAVGVTTGEDAHAFVQITPRLGDGNLYLEQGTSSGTVTAAGGAAALQLGGLETLFRNMSDSMAGATACASETTGLARSLATNARMNMGDGQASGAADVAAAFCAFFAGGEDGSTPMWGSRLLSPTLGRCDLTGSQPVCRISFVLQDSDGNVMPVGNGMGVTQEAGVWKFLGDLLPVSINASAKAQRTRRIDTPEPVDNYSRAFAFEVSVAPGLACAKVSQRSAEGTATALGYYKLHAGAHDQRSLSLWTADGYSMGASLDPLVGATRSGDDTWLALPDGDEGDAVVRNFYRGGRSVTVSLYGDAACSVPFAVDGKSEFDVDVDGVPPVWSAMPTLQWPDLDADSKAALRSLALDAGASGSFHAAWSFSRGPLGLNGSTVCGSRASCGRGDGGRLGERDLKPGARDVTVTLANTGVAVGADDDKTLALYGRTGEGVDLQSNYSSCPQSASGESCH